MHSLHFDKAIELEPANCDPLLDRSNAHAQLRQFDRAFKDANAALAINQQCIDAYCARGIVFLNTHNRKAAILQHDTTLKIDAYDKYTKILDDSIKDSYGKYADEVDGSFWACEGRYVAGYYKDPAGDLNVLWTFLVSEALRLSNPTSFRVHLAYGSGAGRHADSHKWEEVDPAEAKDLD